MTRAEERAKAYEESLDYYHCMNDWPSIAYREGYEQAEKDTIERAIDWLKDYVKYFEIYDEKGIEEFRKAMEEKK